jgi:hypothetical protein
METKCNLLENFVLMALDSNKGKFLIDSISLNYGIAGAILLELSELNKISIKDKKLLLTDKKHTGNEVFDTCIQLIDKSKRVKKVKFWINKIGNRSSRFKKNILADLKNKGILTVQRKSYLWGLIKIYSYPIIQKNMVYDIKSRLKKIILENEKADLNYLLLISLMNSCKLIRVVFVNKKEYKAAKEKIKHLTQDIEITDAVGIALKEVQAAVMVATTSAFIGASSAQ